jgi:hypothetical protein
VTEPTRGECCQDMWAWQAVKPGKAIGVLREGEMRPGEARMGSLHWYFSVRETRATKSAPTPLQNTFQFIGINS